MMKAALKHLLAPILFRHVNSGLQPERLMLFLTTLEQRRDVEGAVLEVGCDVCGTSIIAHRMMNNLNIVKEYHAVDTFSGFVKNQFEQDLNHGTDANNRNVYNGKSLSLVQRILRFHSAQAIRLVQGDIVQLAPDQLPSRISVCLMDVDLEVPIYEGLKKVFPLVASGGTILVDDCADDTTYGGARVGYERFCSDAGVTPHYKYGAGILNKD